MDRLVNGSWLVDTGLEQHQSQFLVLVEFIEQNKINIGLLLACIFLAVRQVRSKNAAAAKAGPSREFLEADGFPEIERLDNFRWQDEEPIKLRAFKSKYFLTMAIQNLDPSELLTMDRNYAKRIEYRKHIIKENGDICIGVNDDSRIRPAILELYTYLLGHYLPKRYPSMFKLHFASFETGDQFMLENLVTKQMFPTEPTTVTGTRILLSILGQILDEDFLFLLPEQDTEDPKYKLEAYICICPSGWDPREKLGKRLAAIHAPVPGYKDKLEGSMDRYFKSLEVGKYVKRSNWSITEHEELFVPDPNTNHGKVDREEAVIKEINPDKTYLRCERQTLHRLPKSKAIVFAFKTYMDTLRDVKLEGIGESVADAVDGLKIGNVPSIDVYKRGPVWGDAVKDFMRS